GEVLLMENTRFEPGEKMNLSSPRMGCAHPNMYISDAFGTALLLFV
ncbi:MAG: phosphoglycerate kinase, partial [Saprospiraceae bacterium]|nr:phosphoglycerate kinase [Saprospiraceae bacterium]